MKFKVHKNKNYTIMSNYHLQEKDMCLKSKGLLSVILSLPDDWDFSVKGLASLCKEGEQTINTILKELKEFGYLEVKKLLPNETSSGRIEYEYIVYEVPQKQEKQDHKKQGVVLQGVEKQGVVFCGQQNTNKLNTNKQSTKNKSPINPPRRKKDFSTFDTDEFFDAALRRSYEK